MSITNVPELFGSMVFNDTVMKERLPKDVYKKLKKTMREGTAIDADVAAVVATAMKDWAISKGATHYTHWFQPMTGITAEKHDSFISPTDDGHVMMEFSGKELIKGEPDASSFPSGGLRATFEARGYTAWDPTSYAFVKDGSLYIPTAFCSYTGQILDKKTPLLRSMDAISTQACRILKLFGKDVKRVTTTVGPEQEYFLIDREDYAKRKDLIFTGRTLFGAMPPKGQEMDDHYFGALRPRVAAFMQELDEELWKLGILSKTKHNEVAPCQHEMAPVFTTTNIATDHNQLTMEVMRTVAQKHGFTCLLHEKPFEGVNGSGKHNNWSISTDRGENLLEPGKNPSENTQFILFLTAVIKAVDEYQDLLRISVASAGNDHRLGANEAPPAIISMFIGDELQSILDSIESGAEYTDVYKTKMNLGAAVLPPIPKDTTDRNRTSPFAFTGNKFEFRSLGSAVNIACANVMLNTAVAEELRQFADELEGAEDFEAAVYALIKREIKAHKRIIFNGNGYDESWVVEAEKRGLLNFKSAADAFPHYVDQKNLDLFAKHNVYTSAEIYSRMETQLEEYNKILHIEAMTMSDMVREEITPACIAFENELAGTVNAKKAAGVTGGMEADLLGKVSELTEELYTKSAALDEAVAAVPTDDNEKAAHYYHDVVISAMDEVRAPADKLEGLVGKKFWPFPTAEDFEAAVYALIKREIKAHKRIIFNGNGYDESWVVEAEKRGLLNFKSAADAFPHYVDQKNLDLFAKHNVYTSAEIYSRMETQLEEYNKILHIEAMTMSDMVREEITPACIAFENELAGTVNAKKAAGVTGGMEADLLGKVSELTEELYTKSAALDEAVAAVPTDDNEKAAHYYHDVVISAMDEVRAPADKLEGLVGKKFWPFPTYSDILFYV